MKFFLIKLRYFSYTHCLLRCLSNRSNALLSSVNLTALEIPVNATPTEFFWPTVLFSRAHNTWFSKLAKACSLVLSHVPNIQISTRLQLSHGDIWNAHRIKLLPRASKYPPLCPITIVHSSGMAHPQKSRPGKTATHSPWSELQSLGWRIPGSQVPRAQSKVKERATKGGGLQPGKRSLKHGPRCKNPHAQGKGNTKAMCLNGLKQTDFCFGRSLPLRKLHTHS